MTIAGIDDSSSSAFIAASMGFKAGSLYSYKINDDCKKLVEITAVTDDGVSITTVDPFEKQESWELPFKNLKKSLLSFSGKKPTLVDADVITRHTVETIGSWKEEAEKAMVYQKMFNDHIAMKIDMSVFELKMNPPSIRVTKAFPEGQLRLYAVAPLASLTRKHANTSIKVQLPQMSMPMYISQQGTPSSLTDKEGKEFEKLNFIPFWWVQQTEKDHNMEIVNGTMKNTKALKDGDVLLRMKVMK